MKTNPGRNFIKYFLIILAICITLYVHINYQLKATVKQLRAVMIRQDDQAYEQIVVNVRTSVVVKALATLLSDKESLVRIQALERIIPYRKEWTIPPIRSLLTDGDPVIRRGAAIALGEIGSKMATKRLCRALTEENINANIAEIMTALIRINDIRAVPFLEKKLTAVTDGKLQLSLVACLFVLTNDEIYLKSLESFIIKADNNNLHYLSMVVAMSGSAKLYNAIIATGSGDNHLELKVNAFIEEFNKEKSKIAF